MLSAPHLSAKLLLKCPACISGRGNLTRCCTLASWHCMCAIQPHLLLLQALDSETHKAMMAWYHKKQQQEQVHRFKRMQYSISTQYKLASWAPCQQDMWLCLCSMPLWPATDCDNGYRSWRPTTMTTATAIGQAPIISNQPCTAWAVYPGVDAWGHRQASKLHGMSRLHRTCSVLDEALVLG